MKFKFLILICFTSIFSCFSQEKVKYLEDKSSAYFSVINSQAIGRYKNVLKNDGGDASDWGIVLGYLINPYRGKRPSPLFYGVEFGYQSGGTDEVTARINGDFAARYNNYWLNGVARYRPILGSTRLNPYVDFFGGGKIIATNTLEYISKDESQSLAIHSKIVPNYGFGVGTGIKLTGSLKNSYLDIGVYYQQSDPTKVVRRNSVVINSDFSVDYRTTTTNTNQILIKVGLTGFFSN